MGTFLSCTQKRNLKQVIIRLFQWCEGRRWIPSPNLPCLLTMLLDDSPEWEPASDHTKTPMWVQGNCWLQKAFATQVLGRWLLLPSPHPHPPSSFPSPPTLFFCPWKKAQHCFLYRLQGLSLDGVLGGLNAFEISFNYSTWALTCIPASFLISLWQFDEYFFNVHF